MAIKSIEKSARSAARSVKISRSFSEVLAITTQENAPGLWAKFPVSLRAIILGLLVGLTAANVWPLFLLHLGVPAEILVSSLFFTAVHLTKGWATLGMVPIVFAAGVLLGFLAWSSGSLIPCMIGHALMDIGLFAYWWTGVAGNFTARPISETGMDQPFLIACAAFAISLFMVLLAISNLRGLDRSKL